MPDGLTFTFHGARGSVAIDRADSVRYGGSTICISGQLDDDHYLVFDAGTGLRQLQHDLPERDDLTFSFLVTHFHWDHLLGLPFFAPLYVPGNTFAFYARPWADRTVEEGISGVMSQPLFPVPLSDTPATKTFHEAVDESWGVGDVSVRSAVLDHPQGVTAYRIDFDGRSLVLATDVEAGNPESDQALTDLARGADVLIHDAQYLPDEIGFHAGWGHSTWEEAVTAAQRAEVGRLVLVSHDPERTDAGVDELLTKARDRFPATEAAFAGMQVEL